MAQTVKYVKFGSSDMMVSELCVGTMTWGSFNNEEETFKQLDLAMARGLNFIDTAEMYPVPPKPDYINRTEVLLGKWLQARSETVDRSKIYIATKASGSPLVFPPAALPTSRAGYAAREDPLGDRPPPNADLESGPVTAHTAEQLLSACRASIERLQCEYIDLYQLHWPQRYAPAFGKVEYKIEKERPEGGAAPEDFDAIVLGIKGLFDAKLIRNWGLSNETSFGIMSFCLSADRLGVPRPCSVQNDVSLLNRGFEQEVAEVCRHFDVAGMPYGALSGGTLSGKYDDGNPPASARHAKLPNFQPRYHSERSLAATRKYSALAKKHGLTTTQLALGWMRSRWWNTSVITGSTSEAQLDEYIDAFLVELSPEILSEIDAIHAEHRNPNVLE